MTGVYAGVIDARLWVLVPNIVETNFRRGGGWDVETKWFGRLPEWDWSEKGVEPVVQSMSSEDSGEDVPMLLCGGARCACSQRRELNDYHSKCRYRRNAVYPAGI